MAEYTPDDEDMRKRHRYAWEQRSANRYAPGEADAQWSRWLAAHDARVRREAERSALDGLIDAAQREHDRAPAPYRYRFEKVVSIAKEYRDTHYPAETEDQT